MTPLMMSRTVALSVLVLILNILTAFSSPTGDVLSISTTEVDVEESTTTSSREVAFEWSSNVSMLYPPSSPLTVQLGALLKISCPKNATSNIWIQKYLQQYEQCDCNTTSYHEGGTDYSESTNLCIPRTNTRQVCQDEVLLEIVTASNNLPTALSFDSGETYYFISYSPGDKPLAGYSENTSGGECLQGYKMVLYVQSNNPPTTTETLTTSTTTQEPTTESDPLVTTVTSTKTGVTSTTQFRDTQFTEDGITTSGTAMILLNMNYLTVIALLCLWYVS